MTYRGAFELVDSTLSKLTHKPEQIDVVVFPSSLHVLGVRDSLVGTDVQVDSSFILVNKDHDIDLMPRLLRFRLYQCGF